MIETQNANFVQWAWTKFWTNSFIIYLVLKLYYGSSKASNDANLPTFEHIEVGKALVGHSQNKAFFSLTLECHNRLAWSTTPLLLVPRPPIQILTCLCYKRRVIPTLLHF